MYLHFQAATFGEDALRVTAVHETQMMPRFNVTRVNQFSHLPEDFLATEYLERGNSLPTLDRPVLTTGDGNCLFNALSITLVGNESLSTELRVRTCCEMATNKEFYTTQSFSKDFLLCSMPFAESTLSCARSGSFSNAWTIQAAASAIHVSIEATYPYVNGAKDYQAQMLNRTHDCRILPLERLKPLKIMWTRMGQQNGKIWLPNHFVALVPKVEKTSTPEKALSDLIIDESPISIAHSTKIGDCDQTEVSSIKTTNENHEDTSLNPDTTNNLMKKLPYGKLLAPAEIMNIIASDCPTTDTIPRGQKENVYIVLNNSENLERLKNKQVPRYWDDCGAWDYKKSRSVKTHFLLIESDQKTTLSHVVLRDNIVHIETKEKGQKILKPLNPQPPHTDIVTVSKKLQIYIYIYIYIYLYIYIVYITKA